MDEKREYGERVWTSKNFFLGMQVAYAGGQNPQQVAHLQEISASKPVCLQVQK
jgi:hypothetical protein